MAKKSMSAAPGTAVAKSGKTAVRSTMTPVFGKGAKRSTGKRGGRSR